MSYIMESAMRIVDIGPSRPEFFGQAIIGPPYDKIVTNMSRNVKAVKNMVP